MITLEIDSWLKKQFGDDTLLNVSGCKWSRVFKNSIKTGEIIQNKLHECCRNEREQQPQRGCTIEDRRITVSEVCGKMNMSEVM